MVLPDTPAAYAAILVFGHLRHYGAYATIVVLCHFGIF